MLAGDFTAFASPACNGGRQRTLTGGFVNNRIDPSRLSPVALNFLKHVPVSTDPCGKLQYGIPNNSTEHQALGKVDYTINSNSSLFARYFYAVYDNPATYDGTTSLTLSRTGQNNQAHSIVARPQSGAVGVDAQLAACDVQQDAERSAAAVVSSAPTDLGSQDLQPGARATWASASPATASRVGNGGTNPGLLQLDRLPDRRRRRPRPRQPSAVDRRQLDPLEDRDAEQPADQRRSSRSTARAPACRLPTS